MVDECEYLAGSWCDLSNNPCFRDTGDCDTWNELSKEEEVAKMNSVERIAKLHYSYCAKQGWVAGRWKNEPSKVKEVYYAEAREFKTIVLKAVIGEIRAEVNKITCLDNFKDMNEAVTRLVHTLKQKYGGE